VILALLALADPSPATASVSALTDRILLLHVDEGYVRHHGKGQKRSDEEVVVREFDPAKASFRVTVNGRTTAFERIGWKSKGTDFAWFVDRWENNRAVNTRRDHAKEHWVYIQLGQPLAADARVTVSAQERGELSGAFQWSAERIRSEAVHVNSIGYAPASPQKFAYVSQWMGSMGPLELSEERRFQVLDAASGGSVFTGTMRLRRPADAPETFHKSDSPPHGNYQKAPVYECDFSALTKPGRYRVTVDGVGSSFEFRIAEDAYREPFVAVARALYHNRSGIELKAPYTEFTRPAPHHPKLTPGFAGRLKYTRVPFAQWGSEGGDREKLAAGFVGEVESAGWYQDAGDWDSYPTHLRVAQELLFAFEVADGFRDGELNIPESGNGIPDIVDEAAWLPRFCYRLRQELLRKKWGTGGIGLRVAGDAFGGDGEGVPSYLDTNRDWAVSGEDAISTARYAGVAAHLALVLKKIGKADPEGVDWRKEAVEAYDWAIRNTSPAEEASVRVHRAYAAATLWRLTGEEKYRTQFDRDTQLADKLELWDEERYPAMAMALAANAPDTAIQAVFRAADRSVESADRRAMRFAGNWSMPMLIGQQTTPWALEVAVGYRLAKGRDPVRAKRYLGAVYTTADYFLGGNALNMVWVTGVGPRHPQHIFHMDAWYNGKGKMHPGLIPYSPWRKEKDVGQGPWDADWPNATTFPKIDDWPGAERYFDNRCSPLAAEFTVHQNIGPAAAYYGILTYLNQK